MNLSNSKLLCLWPCNISYMFDNQEYHQWEDNISISFWLHSLITRTVELLYNYCNGRCSSSVKKSIWFRWTKTIFWFICAELVILQMTKCILYSCEQEHAQLAHYHVRTAFSEWSLSVSVYTSFALELFNTR